VRRIAALVLLTLVSACSSRQLPADATGVQVFSTICARCHGKDLGGGIGPALGQGSEAAGMTDEFYHTTIVHGLGRMPSFGSTLSDQQVERVIEYIREQQGNG
jgi:aldose sugar dehydrogenase